MKEKLEKLLTEGRARIEAVRSEPELQEVKALLLGKQGSLTGLLKELPKLDAALRPEMGKAVNQAKAQRTALLDYFAVRCDLRGSGVGTAALQLIRDYYALRVQDLLLECEHPAEAPDPAVARRRIGFYLRAGARATALESRVFGARYSILQLPCGETLLTDGTLNTALQTLYSRMVPQPYYRGSVIFYGN